MKNHSPRSSKTLGFLTAAALVALAAWPASAAADEAEDDAAHDAEMAAYMEREEAKEDERLDKIEKKNAARELKEELQRRMERGEIEGETRSPAMITIGSLLLGGGLAGSIAFAVAASNVEVSSGGGFMDFSGLERLGQGLLIVGSIASAGAGLGGGLPLIILGARKVPVDDAPPAGMSYVPEVNVGAGSVTATWAF